MITCNELDFGRRGMHKFDYSDGRELMKEYTAYEMKLTHFIKTDKGYIVAKAPNETTQTIFYYTILN